jgi:hypothetical protein
MKLIFKDLFKILFVSFVIIIMKFYSFLYEYKTLNECLNYLPIHIIISIFYLGGIKICLNVIKIKNCNKEYSEILDEIKEARNYYKKYNIKYD